MRTLFHRLFGLTRTRGFDAAGGGRRWEGARTVDGLNTAILAGATTAARRAGWYARNNPWVAAAVDGLVGNVVGAGIKPQSTHPDRAVRERLQVLWLRWKTMPIRVAARYQGICIVEYNGKRVTYATDAEMAAALVDLNRQISDTTARIAVVRNCRVRKGIGSFARAVTTSPEREPCNQAPLGRLSLSCLLLPGPAIGAATCRAVFWIRSSLSAMQRVSPFRVCSLNVRPLVSP
jgi:capsid protein